MADKKESFDFKKRAAELFKRIREAPVSSAGAELARAAIELVLREAHAQGMTDARGPGARSARASQSSPGGAPQRLVKESDVCEHEWEEAFLDGRAIGGQCVHCGTLQATLRENCSHYFVNTGKEETCIACRATRRAR